MDTHPQTPGSMPFPSVSQAESSSRVTWEPPTSTMTPSSSSSSGNTYILPTSPMKQRRLSAENYKPRILKSCGQRPACLVNASVTYCGDNQVYFFGGFDVYTDEVYNHVLKLDLNTFQWTLVDNHGDIPGVRMGHTACLWQSNKILIFGGENEHRDYLSDVVIFDIKTATWSAPEIRGPIPHGRARHAAAVYDEKLFIMGGIAGNEQNPLDDICCLDLKTWTWSRPWKFVARFDHSAWVWGNRLWVFGGMANDMERPGDLWWLDLKSSPAFKYGSSFEKARPRGQPSSTTGYSANSSSVQIRSQNVRATAPGSVSALSFVYGAHVPQQSAGAHFHAYSSGSMLDFVTPQGTIRQSECSLSVLDLTNMQWSKLADGVEVFEPGYRWHYCALNEEGTKAWLLGCPSDVADGVSENVEEYLSDVLTIDLKRYGLLGNQADAQNIKIPVSPDVGALGADLANMFDKPDEGDFIITGERDEVEPTMVDEETTSTPIHVHKLILQARWPHFNRVYNAQMSEFHTKKMHIPEPYKVVRAFLYYLYTDSIAKHELYCPSLEEVAGMLVMSHCYDMPRLKLLCIHRLSRELDIESAAVVWERASSANEEWLKKRAASFCLTNWGRLVRTEGFKRLSRQSIMELCEVTDIESRVIGGDELDAMDKGRRQRYRAAGLGQADDGDDGDDDDEGMELS